MRLISVRRINKERILRPGYNEAAMRFSYDSVKERERERERGRHLLRKLSFIVWESTLKLREGFTRELSNETNNTIFCGLDGAGECVI